MILRCLRLRDRKRSTRHKFAPSERKGRNTAPSLLRIVVPTIHPGRAFCGIVVPPPKRTPGARMIPCSIPDCRLELPSSILLRCPLRFPPQIDSLERNPFLEFFRGVASFITISSFSRYLPKYLLPGTFALSWFLRTWELVSWFFGQGGRGGWVGEKNTFHGTRVP